MSLAQATSTYDHNKSAQIDLLPLCQQITSEMVPLALKKEIDLGFACDLQSAIITGETDLLKEALLNLIDNSIVYCSPGSAITVRLNTDQTNILIEVEDNGPGIPDTIQETIFERFNRGPHIAMDADLVFQL